MTSFDLSPQPSPSRRFAPWVPDTLPLTGFAWCPSWRSAHAGRPTVRAHAPVTDPIEVPPIEEPFEVPPLPPTEDPPAIPDPMDPRMASTLEHFLSRWRVETD